MLPIEKLLAVEEIISHEGCADGIASTVFLHQVLPRAKIRFIQYGTEARRLLQPKPNMLFIDFSPHPDNYQPFIDAGALILDHHKGEKAMVAQFGDNGIFADENEEPGVSGAFLAFRDVWKVLRENPTDYELTFAHRIATLCGIRDTWQTHSPDWAEACVLAEAFRFYPAESWLLEQPFVEARKDWWEARISTGEVVTRRNAKSVKRAVDGAYRFTTEKGTRVVLFAGSRLSSDAAELVHHDADLVVGFDYFSIEDGAANLTYSTRSHTTFNCLTFCKAHGGGGHTQAAGFTVKFDPKTPTVEGPYAMFIRLLERYEASL